MKKRILTLISLTLATLLTFAIAGCEQSIVDEGIENNGEKTGGKTGNLTFDAEKGNAVYGTNKGLYFFDGDEKVVISFPDGSTTEINGELDSFQISLDGSKGAVLVDVDYERTGSTLYYAGGAGKPVKVADNVDGFKLADSGNGLMYYTDHDYENYTARLNLFDGTNSFVIHEEAYYDGWTGEGGNVISPDGKTVFYMTDVEMNYDDDDADNENTFKNKVFVSVDGSQRFFDDDVIPLAAADGAKYLYFGAYIPDDDVRLIVQKGLDQKTRTVMGESQSIGGVFLNKDYSQMVFNTEDSAFISINGGAGQQITATDLFIEDFIIPQNARSNSEGSDFIKVYGFDDFAGKVFVSDEDCLYRLNKDFDYKAETITDRVYNPTMSADGEQLFAIDGWHPYTYYENYERGSGNLLIISADSKSERNVVAEKVKGYAAANDGNVYYVTADNTLYRKKLGEEGQGVPVAKDVYAGNLCVSDWGTVFYMDNSGDAGDEGALWYVGDSENVKVNENVRDVQVWGQYVFYYKYKSARYGNDLFRSCGSDNTFELFASGVSLPDDSHYYRRCDKCGVEYCGGNCTPCEKCGEKGCWGYCDRDPCDNCGERYCWGCEPCEFCGESQCWGYCQPCEFCGEEYCRGFCQPCEFCGEEECGGYCLDEDDDMDVIIEPTPRSARSV